jgi:hypothetical protein
MRSFFFAALFLFCSCTQKSAPIVKQSSGNINTVTVVIPDLLWSSDVGNAVRAAFAYPAPGLPQQEPLFDLKQVPPEVFTGFVRMSRAIIWVGLSDKTVLRTDTNRYASPQQMAVFSAPNNEALIEMILSQSEGVIAALKRNEINERQRRTNKSTLKQNALRELFGFDATLPSAYKLFKENKQTAWFQREIRKGHINLLFYTLPRTTKLNWEDPLEDIIRIRDSVGLAFVPGRLTGSHMITEEAYEPYVFYTSLDSIPALEIRGTWEVSGDFMAGPFVQFVLDDKKANRYTVMEGFVSAPSATKRDYIFEAESVMRSWTRD